MPFMMANEGWDAADAFYFWSMTVSTVGYGDLRPITPEGKALSMVISLGGVLMFVAMLEDSAGGTASSAPGRRCGLEPL